MNVLVERYQRRKYVNQEDSQVLYYVRQKSGTVRVMDVNKLADAIEANSSLTAGDVKHAIEAFVEQLRLSLTQGDKVKIDGLGTFHITLSSEGTEKEKDCTVRSIRRVNVRFVADKALHLVNTSHTATAGGDSTGRVAIFIAAKMGISNRPELSNASAHTPVASTKKVSVSATKADSTARDIPKIPVPNGRNIRCVC